MNLSQVAVSEHCGEANHVVKELVRGSLKTTSDVEDFYTFLKERDDQKNELCSLSDLVRRCSKIRCELCFKRAHQYITSHPSFDDGVVPLEFLGPDPLEVISRCGREPSTVFRPGFLATVHDSISPSPFMPIQPRYQLSTFLANLKTVLDLATDVRASGKDLHELESKTDEQNQYIGMMVDCTTEFLCAVMKFESTCPFRAEPNKHVRALVDAFERLSSSLFTSCHKARERLDRKGVPSVLGISMTQYLNRYREDASAEQFKTALLSLHILNLQRVEAFRTFYSEACDQIVVFESDYVMNMTRMMKYTDQDDFALPLTETPMKIVLLAQLEMGLGPLIQRGAEFTQGRYPSMVQELAMLELRASKIQQGHIEVWTRTKDRVLDQLLPAGFPLTETLRTEIRTASSDAIGVCVEAVKIFTGEMNMAAPVIDALMRSNPLEGLKMRYLLRMSNLKMLCEFSFGLRHLCSLAAFLHDYFPVMQEHVCGTDSHVQMYVRDLVLESHIRDLLAEFTKYSSQKAFESILSDAGGVSRAESNRVRTSLKKIKVPKQKKMEGPPNHSSEKASAAAAPQPSSPLEHENVCEEDFESGWEEVRSKKKSPLESSKEQHPSPKKKNERTRGKSVTQTKKVQPPSNSRNSQSKRHHSPASASSGRDRVRGHSPNPVRAAPAPSPAPPASIVVESVSPLEPEPSLPEPVVEPESEPEPSSVCAAPITEAVEETPAATEPTQPKRERRRGKRGGGTSSATAEPVAPVLNDLLFARASVVPIDPLVLASYAASQVSAPVPMQQAQMVAVPARMFGGVLSIDYASVPFMTFPRVYV